MKNILLGLLIILAGQTRGQYCFGNFYHFYGGGSIPRQVITDDFNADGKKDLAVANQNSNNFSILLGAGNGTFTPYQNIKDSLYPYSLTSGDFNGDGKIDIASANYGSDSVKVFLGTGTGSFTPFASFSVGSSPVYIISGDFNGDTKLDLATANYGTNYISVLLGMGNGSFSPSTNFTVDVSPTSIISADFNGDTKLDLAVSNGGANNISILLGIGTGSFSPAVNFQVGTLPNSLTSADFDGDSKLDIAVANYSGNSISLLFGNGAGNFVPTSTISVARPFSISNSDFDSDGKIDLVSANYSSFPRVSIFLGTGTGTFGSANFLMAGSFAVSVIATDFNGDLKPDLAVANSSPDAVSVLLNCSVIGIEELNSEQEQISIYPNPSSGNLKFDIRSTEKINIRIFDVEGNLVLNPKFSENSDTDISTLADGIYNLSILTNKSVFNKKIVIIH